MPTRDPHAPEAPRRRRSICTIASWAVPVACALLTFMAYQGAVARRSPGDWLPGIGELLVGAILTALAAFGFGLAALLRREQNRWVALLPCLTGLGFILYFGGNFLRNQMGIH